MFRKFRDISLLLAESFDAWRIIPRVILVGYSILIVNMYQWYIQIPTYVQESCDPATLQIFLNNKTPIEDAQKIACSVEGITGGPTTNQTALVTAIIGLATLIFGFYVNTGRNWVNNPPK